MPVSDDPTEEIISFVNQEMFQLHVKYLKIMQDSRTSSLSMKSKDHLLETIKNVEASPLIDPATAELCRELRKTYSLPAETATTDNSGEITGTTPQDNNCPADSEETEFDSTFFP